jgi:Rrf2 family protein
LLSQKTRYALKALLELSALPAGATLSSAAISARRAIPVKFLEAILSELKRGGLVRGQRGRSGGYQLARSGKDISFGLVVRLMEGPLALISCVSVTQYRRCADCPADETCELRKAFQAVRDSSAAILDGWTLEDARAAGGATQVRTGALRAKKARRRLQALKSSGRKGTAKDKQSTLI